MPGTEELKKFGTFKDGIFRRNDDVEGRRNVDGYQAIWEHMNGQRMEYPKPRYRDPIMVDPANYEWLAVAGMPGVAQKPLGTFTERQCAAALIKLARGATYRAGGRSVYLVVSGSGHRARYAVPANTRRSTSTKANRPTWWRGTKRRSAPRAARSGRPRKRHRPAQVEAAE